jgi:hypothetical protein
MRTPRLLVLAATTLCGVLSAPTAALAHDLRATVTVADDGVKVLAYYFEDDTPAEQAEVKVIDASDAEVAAGQTDDRGVWAFSRPAPGEYTLTVESAGHVARVKFSVGGGTEGPAEFTAWRLNKWLGLAIGVFGLLGVSAAFWLLRRRRGNGLD